MPDTKSILKKDNDFYSDDVQAEDIAGNNLNPDELAESKELSDIAAGNEDPVTSGDMEIGDLDKDDEIDDSNPEKSYDEEDVPAGDNVTGK